ncbi:MULTISPECIES: MIP/aquaporin family protein [Dyadobacter]|uniref:Aquaporin family protein n=1 Tax=Dyadobacter chenhuakuii TaxID=2909339 RepID=A0A9X1QCM4_9BACT|nr:MULTISPECIES: MIP/aquaporin family protein [Dyadobacter]MCF2495946.1 aquaporin family protein [Dyadobacter chenhuakuii]MCF2499393.1 aquaporin family protein [Dyadobacter chenhuakuii]MCF2519897.1 aquaporin family protein [Dyadobacter sp. CY351]USJ30016.1 aquaporin family protein [Dyadobacter chenhuakuii]
MQPSPFLGELIGTMVLILLGNGVVANVVLKQTKGENAGWIVITAGWGFAVMIGVFTANAFGSAAAHLNPAVTIGFAFLRQDYSLLASYIPAQLIGAFLGAVLVWLQYLPHWKATEDQGSKLACFATGPAIRSSGANFLSEFIATVILIVGIVAIGYAGTSDPEKGGIPSGFAPYLVGMLVWSIGLSLGGTTGYAINPVRDLGPRIAHAILPIPNKGSSDWSYGWVPVAGPVFGAIAGGLILRFFYF